MNTDYMEALRMQLTCLRRARERAAHRGSSRSAPYDAAQVYILERGTPVFISPWVSKATIAASCVIPLGVPLSRDDLPVPVGFAYLPGGDMRVRAPNEPSPGRLYAIGWCDIAHWSNGTAPSAIDGVILSVFSGDPAPGEQRMVVARSWHYGTGLDPITDDNRTPPDWLIGQQWAYALWAFMRERRVTTATHRGIDRPLRKQAERVGWTHEPIVQVVELRAAEPRHAPSDEHETVDWSCRWAVRGHWHKYHYGDGTVRARWLAPYVKGPAGKALKSATKLLAVVR